MKQQIAPLLILLAAVLWGTTGTVQALAPASAHPVAIGATRLFIGGLFLLIVVLAAGKLNLKSLPLKPTLIASVCIGIYQPLFFSAVAITGVAIGTVVAIGSAPMLAGIIEMLFLRKKPAAVWWVSTTLSIAGVILLFSNQGSVQADPFGILLALGAGFSFACYTIVNKDVVEKMSPLPSVAVVFTLSGLLLSPFLFVFDMSWIFSREGIIAGLHLGVVATGLAYYLFAIGLFNVSSSTAVTLSLGEPLTATLLGVFFLGEYMSSTSWFGLILVLLGIGVLIMTARKPRTAQIAEN
ncbi:EamA family transporter [Jeotgalicoccus halotolerans]|uniref:EamA family transporter n=1 Tax=Jeotgalicoccus nanhaiensis TaxID=568603 RepID=A0ABR9XY10_9STAP|nr:EamA family transporter [Jeotgalicoccus nanhaiensis]MBF0753738.1 EamA family transporter [Jeotgalicoccus nanhaiensis]TFU61902.1 EamA family transporter [Jeotgalicoccus nanhaiensis]